MLYDTKCDGCISMKHDELTPWLHHPAPTRTMLALPLLLVADAFVARDLAMLARGRVLCRSEFMPPRLMRK